jgi:hypothetical protein
MEVMRHTLAFPTLRNARQESPLYSLHVLARKCFVREFKWLTNKTNKMMVNLPLCPGTKCRNTKGADGRFVVVNIQPSTCPKQVAGLQDI